MWSGTYHIHIVFRNVCLGLLKMYLTLEMSNSLQLLLRRVHDLFGRNKTVKIVDYSQTFLSGEIGQSYFKNICSSCQFATFITLK